MNRLFALSALFGILMTGAAAAQTAEVMVQPVNGTCPSGFELQKGASGADDSCTQAAGSITSGSLSMASFTSGGDDDGDHGEHDHDSDMD